MIRWSRNACSPQATRPAGSGRHWKVGGGVLVRRPEMARLGCECPEPGYCFTIDHTCEFRERDIDIEYCEAVTERKEDS